VHYLINKNQILEMAANLTNSRINGTVSTAGDASTGNSTVGSSSSQPNINFMSFSLLPQTQGNATQSTSSDLTTDTGGIHASVSWEPKQLAADTQSTININFSDAFSGEPLNADVLYDFVILNSNGTQLLSKENLTATNASDSQTVTFPSDAIYQIEVNVKGIVRGEQTAAPDTTRSGIARGYVVVPEFPSGLTTTLLLGGSMALLLIMFKKTKIGERKFFKN
jgi:hypothetical protein